MYQSLLISSSSLNVVWNTIECYCNMNINNSKNMGKLAFYSCLISGVASWSAHCISASHVLETKNEIPDILEWDSGPFLNWCFWELMKCFGLRITVRNPSLECISGKFNLIYVQEQCWPIHSPDTILLWPQFHDVAFHSSIRINLWPGAPCIRRRIFLPIP